MNVKPPGRRAVAAIAALIAGVLAAGPVPAQDRIAVVEVERLLRESARGQIAVQELSRLRDEKQAELTAGQEELAALQKQYSDGRLTLAEDRLAELEKELEDRTIELRRSQDDANREMQKLQTERFGEIEQALLPIIAQVGREFGYTAIFNKFQGGLLFASDAADITSLIIERYNAAYPATPSE